MRRAVLALVALVVVALGAGAVYAWSSRPDLESRRDALAEAWDALRPGLDARYEALAAANDAVRAAGGTERDVVRALDVGLAEWAAARRGGGDLAEEVRAANELEGLARRLARVAADSTLLGASSEVGATLAGLSEATLPGAAVDAYARAVAAYEHERRGALRQLVASLFGYDSVPALDAGIPTAAA